MILPADTMRMFAQKHTARELAERAQVRLRVEPWVSQRHGSVQPAAGPRWRQQPFAARAGMHAATFGIPHSSVQVPVLAGSPLLSSAEEALEYARKVGLPVLLKATGENLTGQGRAESAQARAASQ